ncbi:MAG: DEAD/DEAH box helicase family protein [Clostridium sp.]|nr:MAG: DEAD/DEAH box helicase family protein [Clostridium sp.]
MINLFDSEVTIYVYNISKFDKRKYKKMKAFSEVRGMSFYDELAEMKDLVIIMDESHHYRADRGMETINNLKPILGLELTATPLVNVKGKQIPFKNVVYEYPLSEAIKDGYTRVPFAVTRTDINFYNFGDDEIDKLMLNDGILCHKRIKEKNYFYYSRSMKKRI